MNEPNDAIAAGLTAGGFRGGTIVAGFGTLAGNLAVRFPDSRVLHTEYPDFRPPGRGSRQCLLVWDRHRGEIGDRDTPEMPDDLRAFATALRIRLRGTEPVGVVEAPFHFDPAHVRRVHYILIPQGQGWCR
jgi:hypothetical protein